MLNEMMMMIMVMKHIHRLIYSHTSETGFFIMLYKVMSRIRSAAVNNIYTLH